jgi:hypothetical protein
MGPGWLKYFPTASLVPLREVAEWAGQALDRLGESPLHPVEAQQMLIIRLLVLPTWLPACSVRVESRGLSWRLAARELDGEAGFDLGQLARRENRVLSAAEAERVTDLWPYLRFWSQAPLNGGEEVFDGTSLVLEAAEGGRYHVITRDDPEWGYGGGVQSPPGRLGRPRPPIGTER